MGFGWTAISVGDVLLDDIIDQIQTNVNTVYSDLELSEYSWLELPVDAGDEIDDADFQEIRDAIDYADDQNSCRNHDASYNAADNATAKSGDDATAYTGVDNPHNSTVYGSQDNGYDSSYNNGVDAAHDSSVQGTNRSGVDTGHDSTVHSGEDSGVDSSHEASAVGTYDTGNYNAQNSTYNSGN